MSSDNTASEKPNKNCLKKPGLIFKAEEISVPNLSDFL
jgi:hypothetical protein